MSYTSRTKLLAQIYDLGLFFDHHKLLPQASIIATIGAYIQHFLSASNTELHGTILIERDGNLFSAHWNDFVDLQNSPAGFGDTKEAAVADLLNEGSKS